MYIHSERAENPGPAAWSAMRWSAGYEQARDGVDYERLNQTIFLATATLD